VLKLGWFYGGIVSLETSNALVSPGRDQSCADTVASIINLERAIAYIIQCTTVVVVEYSACMVMACVKADLLVV